jgi:hypothetical protein
VDCLPSLNRLNFWVELVSVSTLTNCTEQVQSDIFFLASSTSFKEGIQLNFVLRLNKMKGRPGAVVRAVSLVWKACLGLSLS